MTRRQTVKARQTVSLTVRLTRGQRAAVRAEAKRLCIPVSVYVRRCLVPAVSDVPPELFKRQLPLPMVGS